MFPDIEPIPLDDPHWDGDEIYAAMSLKEKRGLCRMVAWKRQQEAEAKANPPEPTLEGRILAVLERIDQKLEILVAASRERR